MLFRVFFAAMFCSIPAFAGSSEHMTDPVSPVIFWVTLIFLLGVIGRNLAQRLNQPGVLGELLMGVLVGNLCVYFGSQLLVVLREGSAIFNVVGDLLSGIPLVHAVHNNISDAHYAEQVVKALSIKRSGDILKVAYVVDILSRYGVIFLLFVVGLQTSVKELRQTGRESIQVAIIGVLAPILLGLLATFLLLPKLPFKSDLFIAATLSATSIGITARFLSELNIMKSRESRTILGAAMIDDILGLVILAVVSSLVVTGAVDVVEVGFIIVSAVLFFSCSMLFGPWILKQAAKSFVFFQPWEEKLFISFVFSMGLAWIASLVDLSPIIGAFAAGVILRDDFFRSEKTGRNGLSIKELIAPLESIFTPLFFMVIGFQVKLESFVNCDVLLIASGLIVAAIFGKLLSGFGANKRDDRLFIGIGMLPRGEVGLVFASIGRALNVISDDLFSAIILMVIVTTFIAPPWLKYQYAKQNAR